MPHFPGDIQRFHAVGYRLLVILVMVIAQNVLAGDRPELPKNYGEPDECQSAGNPISIATGNKFQAETDITSNLPLAKNLELTRYYNSRANSYSHGVNSFGTSWTHNYKMSISVDHTAAYVSCGTYYSPRDAWVYSADGKVTHFDYYAAGAPDWRGDGFPAKDSYQKLETDYEVDSCIGSKRVSEVRLTEPSGRKITFIPLQENIYSGITKYYPETIEEPSGGDIITINYYNDRRILYVTNQNTGQRLRFNYPVLSSDTTITSVELQNVNDHSGDLTWHYRYDSEDRLQYVDYPDGKTREYHYGPPPNDNPYTYPLLGITDERGARYATWDYDSHRRATVSYHGSAGDPADHVTIAYFNDDNSRIVTNAYGRESHWYFSKLDDYWTFTQVDGEATANCDADTRSREYRTQSIGKNAVSASIDKAGQRTEYEYYWDYARWALPITRVEAKGTTQERTWSYDWYSDWRLPLKIELKDEYQIQYAYSGNQRRLSQVKLTDKNPGTDPYGTLNQQRVWNYVYTYWDLGTQMQVKTLQVQGPRVGVSDNVTYHFSTAGYLTKIVNALNQETVFSLHNIRGQPGKMVDINGIETQFTYSPRGWLETIREDVNGSNLLTQLDYDEVGQLDLITLPNGAFYDFDYDDAQRLISIKSNLDEEIVITPDVASNLDLITISNLEGVSEIINYEFDDLSRVYQLVGNYDQLTQYDYNGEGHLTGVQEAPNPSTGFETDPLNRIDRITYPLGNPVDIAYDDDDRITSVSDPRGLTTEYKYNGFGDVKQMISPDTGTTEYHYDEAGNLTKKINAKLTEVNYTYDLLNRLTSVAFPNAEENIALYYDNYSGYPYFCTTCNGRLNSFEDQSGTTLYFYDTRGNLTRAAIFLGVNYYQVKYDYDDADNIKKVTYPSGRIVDYTLDAMGRIGAIDTQEIAGSQPVPVVSEVKYKPYGPVTGFIYGNDLEQTIDYDLDARVTGVKTGTSGEVQDLGYNYDLVNNVDEITDYLEGNDQDFSYDVLNRLTQAIGRYGTLGYNWDGYDGNGTQLTRTVNDIHGNVTETFALDANSNQLIEVTRSNSNGQIRSISYSDTGNAETDATDPGFALDFTYNGEDRLVKVESEMGITADYTYNALGQRVQKIITGGPSPYTEQYVYDLDGNLIAVLDESGGVRQEYIYLNGVAVAMLADDQPADTDGDGDTDGIDNCPMMPNPSQDDADWDGIGDKCDVPPAGC